MGHRHQPNERLARIIEQSGASRAALAHRINQLAREAGVNRVYTHTSIANWTVRGMTPRPPASGFLAVALGERLGRRVTPDEIGLGPRTEASSETGLDFPRDPDHAVRNAADYWSTVDRRSLLSAAPAFAVAAFTDPVHRWLVTPADATAARAEGRITASAPGGGGRRVGRADLEELWHAADEARRWDSKYGGGTWKSSQVVDCLRERAAPLLTGTYTDAIGRELFTVTAELARVAAWSAFDMGHHQAAQRHFIQALRLARAGGDVQAGAYVLATMSLQTALQGYPDRAIDMAEGAYERAKHTAAPRVLAFAKLIQARAHGLAREPRQAATALAASERLLSSIRPGSRDPQWLAYLTHTRLASDAVEIHRDLRNPTAAFRWNTMADTMPAGLYTRSVGIRHAVLGAAHLQAGNLDQGLAMGDQALDILARVRSTRAHSYLHTLTDTLTPWHREPRVRAFIDRTRTALTT
ncbi:sporulation protein [Streptomyces sp. NPDC088812]|uniref:sporulation protein n=1 Tax=Streptomyces sp. NPDC088812 TaxID=3365905 RepID=UPI0037F3511E